MILKILSKSLATVGYLWGALIGEFCGLVDSTNKQTRTWLSKHLNIQEITGMTNFCRGDRADSKAIL